MLVVIPQYFKRSYRWPLYDDSEPGIEVAGHHEFTGLRAWYSGPYDNSEIMQNRCL